MPTLTIDNKTITVAPGTTVLEAAEKLGVVVPHFCYHKALGSVGACRMCAVNIEEGRFKGIKMSCLVEAEDGMVVTTTDEKSSEFRQRVGEWLMINHPHDCPVCDAGGECQLQEQTIASGQGLRRYDGPKRTYENQDLGPFVSQEMNRCIQCYRCARTYQDYCGGRDFGVMGSRNRVTFGRFKDGPLESDFSGNIIDVCPTGVFTDKTFRFKSRSWDLQQAPSVCVSCSLGCATQPGARLGELQRVRSGVNEEVNGFFICDRGRFGATYVNHSRRPRKARQNGVEIGVSAAVELLAGKARKMVAEHGPDSVLLLGSERASLEANWLLQRWGRDIGCRVPVLSAHEQRHQAAQTVAFDLSSQLASQEDIRNSDFIVVLGVDPLAEAPTLALALRQAVRAGAQVQVFDPRPVELPCEFEHHAVTMEQLHNVINASPTAGRIMLQQLRDARRPVIVAGGDLLGASGLRRVGDLAQQVDNGAKMCSIFPVLGGPNSFGAALLSLPQQQSLLERLESGTVRMLVCLESDPTLEAPDLDRFNAALEGLDELVVLDYMPSELGLRADFFIPTRTPVETDGCFINSEGRLRLFKKVLDPATPVRETGRGDHPPREFSSLTPGGEPVAAVALLQKMIGDQCGLDQLRQQLVDEFYRLDGLQNLNPGDSGIRVAAEAGRNLGGKIAVDKNKDRLQLLITPARYGADLFSRYADNLDSRKADALARMNGDEAAARGLKEGDFVVVTTTTQTYYLPLHLEAQMASGCVLIESSDALTQAIAGQGMIDCQIESGGAR